MGKGGKANRSKSGEASFSELNIEGKLDRLFSKFNDFNNKLSAESVNAKKRHDELTSEIKKINRKVTELDKRVEHMEAGNEVMNEEVIDLRRTVNSLQQAAYKDELIIRGVPEKEKSEEELFTIVQLIVRAVNCVPEPTICMVKRIGKKIDINKNNRPILIQVSHFSEKEKLLAAKKKINVSCAQIKFDDDTTLGAENQVIYFEERLTKRTSDLYRNARILRKQQKLKFVWIRNGQLYVRKRDNDVAICVDSEEQLIQLTRKRKLNSTPKEADIVEKMELDDSEDGDDGSSSSAESVQSQARKKLRTRVNKRDQQ